MLGKWNRRNQHGLTRRLPTPPPDGRPFDIDPENPGDKTDHDRWLRENVPPHHR